MATIKLRHDQISVCPPHNARKHGSKPMASSVKDMLAAANSAVPRIQPADLRDRMSKGDVVVVDVRDAPELATGGKIKGALHVPRGMLEFRADPESPYHNPALRKEKTAVLYCASGGRSALAGKTGARQIIERSVPRLAVDH